VFFQPPRQLPTNSCSFYLLASAQGRPPCRPRRMSLASTSAKAPPSLAASVAGSASRGNSPLSSFSGSNNALEWRVSKRPQDSVRSVPGSRTTLKPRSAHHNFVLSLTNVLPPLFVSLIMATISAVYLGFHILPLLQVNIPPQWRRREDQQRGIVQFIVTQALTTLLLICYARSMLTAPGTVPDTPEWKLLVDREAGGTLRRPQTAEVKLTGERRHCKWCLKYKPDRCHHCRVCNMCILKMDHHCPWIMSCVGFRNHKYFFLLVLYSVASCAFIGSTMLGSVLQSAEQEMSMFNRFILVLGFVLVVIMGTLMTCFLSFHTYLMLSGMTTIEYCEKNTLARSSLPVKRQSYNRGYYRNVTAVLGPQPLLWLLPVDTREGDGLSFHELSSSRPCAVEDVVEVDPEWTSTRGPYTRI